MYILILIYAVYSSNSHFVPVPIATYNDEYECIKAGENLMVHLNQMYLSKNTYTCFKKDW